MSFIVKAKSKILKKLEKFPKGIRKRIEELILTLKENPLPYLRFDLVKMGGYEDTYRIRIGKVRIIYRIDFKNRIVEITEVGYISNRYLNSPSSIPR
jgi:mRNA interferase RelE/StbE